ncbi:high mobility group nucleosome-binding domain-containing protein 5 isoform X2 [Phycodurus eques]|uniref:high mobility group nucleosome-binding domain-containing protein 5 isoform X2 n=1 Tax=Phycodurus eques TaxID=693459 RepID=UPI002ACD61A5|nr:high mobility group nucleosome-binding domain-containing protein 5 isoform X2 [Phycodurus eques]
MAATEASAAPAVQEDGKTPESEQTEAEQPAQNSETVNSEVTDKDGPTGNSEVAPTKETVENDAAASGDEEAGAAGGEAAPARSSENHEHKTSFLDSFLNKSGLGKVMAGRKKKEPSAAAGAGPEDAAAEGAEKAAEEPAGAEGGSEGEAVAEKALENGEKDDEKKGKESKSSVRDLIRKPVARIFSHRSTEKKDGNTLEPPKQVKVRSKSLDRLEDPEALNATTDSAAEEVGGAEVGAEAETEQKASSSSSATTKHMKRWHSFKKLMAQKAHKRNSGAEDGGDGEGGGDSSTLDSKESGQKRWKLKRSWTFQGLKRDPSMAGISGKIKTADKDSADTPEEARDADEGAEEAEAEAEAEGGGEEDKADDGSEEKADGSEEEKAVGGATVTQHANEIWTSFKKRVIPKSKRANTECQPSGEDDAASAAPASGEDGAAEDGKDGKSAKVKRSHFGRAVSLKNFILRKGKSTSVDMSDAAKEEEEEVAAATAEGGEDGNGDAQVDAAAETDDESLRRQEAQPEAQKTPGHAPVTNGENGCENGTAEDDGHDRREDDEKKNNSPLKKAKELGGAKEETNAQVINTMAPPVNSDKKAGSA